MNLMDQLEQQSEDTAESIEGIEIDLRSDLAMYVFDRLEKTGMTQKDLAARLHMGEPQLCKILALDANATLRTIARLFKTFGEKPQITVRVNNTNPHRSVAETKPIGIAGSQTHFYLSTQTPMAFTPNTLSGAVST